MTFVPSYSCFNLHCHTFSLHLCVYKERVFSCQMFFYVSCAPHCEESGHSFYLCCITPTTCVCGCCHYSSWADRLCALFKGFQGF